MIYPSYMVPTSNLVAVLVHLNHTTSMLMDCEQDANFRVDLQNFQDIEKVSVCTMCVCGDVCTGCT